MMQWRVIILSSLFSIVFYEVSKLSLSRSYRFSECKCSPKPVKVFPPDGATACSICESHGPLVRNGSVYSFLQVGNLKHGKWPIPANLKVVMEIGANNRNTLDQEYLPSHTDSFLLTFEPLLDKYAALVARLSSTQIDKHVPLGFHHQRGIIMPWAISGTRGSARFNLAPVDGCSSLLEPNSDQKWAPWCKGVPEIRSVPTIPLEEVLRMLPDGIDVEYLKIDAQGMDVMVVESAGSEASRIRRVTIETVTDREDCGLLYLGQPRCSDAVNRLQRIGFMLEGSNPCKSAGNCEFDLHFSRLKMV